MPIYTNFYKTFFLIAALCILTCTAYSEDSEVIWYIPDDNVFQKLESIGIKKSLILANTKSTMYEETVIAEWKATNFLKYDFQGDGIDEVLVGVRTYESFKTGSAENPEEAFAPAGAHLLVFEKNSGKWNIAANIFSGMYIGDVQFVDITGDGRKDLAVYGGSGNHGRSLSIWTWKKGKLISIGGLDAYGKGITIKEDGVLVMYHQELEGPWCEACQSYHPEVIRYKNGKFVSDPDDFVECLKKTFNAHDDKKAEKARHRSSADCFASYSRKYPHHYASAQNAAHLYLKTGQKEKAKEFIEKLGKIDLKKNDCAFCDDYEKKKKNLNKILNKIKSGSFSGRDY